MFDIRLEFVKKTIIPNAIQDFFIPFQSSLIPFEKFFYTFSGTVVITNHQGGNAPPREGTLFEFDM